jgi:hypothetical protein
MPRITQSGGIEGYGEDFAVSGTDPVFISVTFTSSGPGPTWESFFIQSARQDPATHELTDFTFLLALGGFAADTFSASTVLPAGTDRYLAFSVQVDYFDERHEWSFAATFTTINTLPLIFDPWDPDNSPLVESETEPGILVSTGSLDIFHQHANGGLHAPDAAVRIDVGARRAYLPRGDYTIFQFGDDAPPGVSILIHEHILTGAEAFISFDDAVLSPGNYLFRGNPLTLGGFDVALQDMHIDDRGVVFGFIVDLPDIIGVDVRAENKPRDEGLITAWGDIIGPAAWSHFDLDDVVLLDRFSADLRDVVVRWNEATATFTWEGGILARDLLGAGSRLALHTLSGHGFYANAVDAGLEGALVGGARATIEIGEAGNTYDLILDDIVYLPQLDAPDLAVLEATLGFRLGTRFVHLDTSLSINVDTAGFSGTGATFGYEAVEALGLPPIETGFAGVTLTFLDATIAGLAGDAPTLGMLASFEIGQGGVAPLLTLDTNMTAQGSHGLQGIGVLHHGGTLLEVFGLVDVAFDTAFGTLRGDGTLDLRFDMLGAFLDAEVDVSFLQYEGANRSFEMRGDGVVNAMPDWLAALYGVTGAFEVELTASILPFAPADSFLDLTGPLYSASLGGYVDFGLRYWFDGRLDLLGGVGLGDAAFEGSGGAAGPFSFTLAAPTDRLVLRAEGDADADGVTLVTPGGARLVLADFAARGIEVLSDDATGLTLLVNDAEAGTWMLEAPDATGFSGFAMLPELTLDITAIATADGPGLSAVAHWAAGVPDGGFAFRLFDDDDDSGFDGASVFYATADADGVFEIAFADLGLAPGEHFFHVQALANGLLPVGAYLDMPVTITGVADLAITGDFFWVQPPLPEDLPDGEAAPEPYAMLGITVTNEGTATALAPTISFIGASLAPLQIEDLAPAETRHLLLDLGGSGVSPDTFYIVLDVLNGGFEADLSDNSFEARARFPDVGGPVNDLLVLEEDGTADAFVLGNDPVSGPVTLVAGPRHGSVELISGFAFRYTPDPDFHGADAFTYAAGGGAAQVWITVTPVNDAPVLVAPIADIAAVVAQPLSILPGAAAFADPDGAVLTYDLTTAQGDPLPGWLLFDSATGGIAGTPSGADAGTLDLLLTAFDEGGLSASASFALRITAPGGGTDGPDSLLGGSGTDSILAGDGDDTVNGRTGDDSIAGGEGHDRLAGAAGNDSLAGDDGDDRAAGGTGDDSLAGGLGADVLAGDAGADSIDGGDGADLLRGGDGADTLGGGAGRDRLFGDAGADVFAFAVLDASASDLIEDFAIGEDMIAVSAAAFGGGLVEGMDLAASGRFRAASVGLSNSPAGTGQFTYETDTGKLWWDADGAGGPTLLVARFVPMPGTALGADDLLVIA